MMKKRVKLTSIFFSVMLVLSTLIAVGLAANAETAKPKEMISLVYNDFSTQTLNNLLKHTGTSVIDKNEILINPDTNDQAGAVFYENKVALADDKSFSTFFKFNIATYTERIPGDGFVFVLNSSTNALGSKGGGLGYSGIDNSIGIEFDTYLNTQDPSANHIGFNVNGSTTSTAVKDLDGTGITLSDKADKFVWIDYDGSSKTLEIRISNTNNKSAAVLLSVETDLSEILGSTDIYAGFTGSTGDCFEENRIKQWLFDSKYNPLDTNLKTYIMAPTAVTVTADPASDIEIGKTSTLTVHVVNADGTDAANINVTLSTDLGTLDTTTVETDANGIATATLTNYEEAGGTANIKAVADGGAFAVTQVSLQAGVIPETTAPTTAPPETTVPPTTAPPETTVPPTTTPENPKTGSHGDFLLTAFLLASAAAVLMISKQKQGLSNN